MTNQLNYKGYIGSVCFSEEDGVFHGKVIGVTDSISFEGESVQSLTDDFGSAIDEYLEFCQEVGKNAEENSYTIRISPTVYNNALRYSAQKGLSFTTFIESAINASLNVTTDTPSLIL